MAVSMLLLITLLSTLFTNAYASLFPSDLLCWAQQSSVVVGKWLYIDGGEVWREIYNGVIQLKYTIAIDLSTSWNTSNVNPIISNHTLGNNMLSRNPMMWYDSISQTVYWYGGWPYFNSNKPGAYGFTPNNQGSASWSIKYGGGITQTATGSTTFQGFTVPGGSLWTASPTAFYSLGGYMSANGDYPALSGLNGYQPALSGLVTYDFQQSTWSNVSSTGYQPNGFAVLGQSVYVPIFGQQGILVFFGGDAPTSQAWTEGAALKPMKEITIYDIQSGNFYQQTASGPVIPHDRVFFCSVGAGAADNSTWEIFMFGGILGGNLNAQPVDPSVMAELGTVYILTLPAFRWIQVPGNVTQRSNHRCQLIGNRQMLSIGGFIDNNSLYKDPWTNGLGIFDMTDLVWKFNYSSDLPAYSPSKLVSNYYSNTSNRYPANWDNSSLRAIFEQPSTPTNGPSTNGLSAGTIAGLAAGAAASLAVIAGLLFLLWKQHQKAKQLQTMLSPHMEMDAGLVPEVGDEWRWEMDGQHGYGWQGNKGAFTRTGRFELQGS